MEQLVVQVKPLPATVLAWALVTTSIVLPPGTLGACGFATYDKSYAGGSTGSRRVDITPHLTRAELKQHQILFDIRDTVDDVYFAIDAVVSLVIPLSTGEMVETAMVGRDGVIGSAAALNGRVSLNQAIVEVADRLCVVRLKH